jgi:hypothetical protein
MTLFDDIERTELRVKYDSESEFDYHNISARPGMVAYREIAERWFANYPDAHKRDLRARYRSPAQSDHFAAFFELYLHQLLLACGYEVEVHPTIPRSRNRPDFFVRNQNGTQCYIEAVLAHAPSKEAEANARRMAIVYDRLNQMHSPNFFVGVHITGAPRTPPPGKALRQELEAWLETLDPDEISSLQAEGRRNEVPRFAWNHEGWSLEFEPLPKSPPNRGKEGVRPLGARVPEARWMNTAAEIGNAVKSKSKKYGRLPEPLVICVNSLDWTHDFDILNALLGDEQTVVSFDGDKVVGQQDARARNGLFGQDGHPQTQRVSAVAVARSLVPFTMGHVGPELFHHPWPYRALPRDFWPMPQWIANHEERRLESVAGKPAWSILALPEPWPTSLD